METFLLTSLEDHRPRRAFKKWCRQMRRGPGITWVELRIRDVSDGNITLAHEFHREVSRAPVAVKTVLEGHNWLYGFLIWLAGPGRAVVGHATVFFGNDIVPYSDAFRLAQKMIEGPMYFTKYQEDRGYQLKTSLHLLLGSGIMDAFRGTHILGPKQLRELYQFDHLEP